MKRIINLFAFVALCYLAISCEMEQKNEITENVQSVAFVIEDFIPEEATKTALKLSTLKYQWSSDDTVGIFPSTGYQAVFPMESGAGSSSAVFDGGGWGLKADASYYAYYPFSKDNFESEDMRERVKYSYEGQVVAFADNDTVKLGKYNYMASGANVVNNETVTFSFKNLGAVCRLSFNAPATASYSKIIISSANAVFPLTGYFDATDKDGDGKLSLESDSELKSQIELLIPEDRQDFTTDDLMEVYFFLPPVNLSSVELKMGLMSTTSDLYEMSFTGKNIQAGKAYKFDNTENTWSGVAPDEGGDGEGNENGGESEGVQSGIYLGIMGFNQDVYSYPIGVLTDESKAGFDSFIDRLNTNNGTLLYYSVDQAIIAMQSATLPSDLDEAIIITFTDGLDAGSLWMNSTYDSDDEYLTALHTRLTQEKVAGKDISAYTIGLKGLDVVDNDIFANNLNQLASDPANAYSLSSMSELTDTLQEIAGQLEQRDYVQQLSLKISGESNGTIVRFTFDNVNSADNSTMYIEGTFNSSTYSLEDVKYVGVNSTSGTEINGVVDGIFIGFTFEGIQTDDNTLIDSQNVNEWIYVTSNNMWQINSEFDSDGVTTGIVTGKSSMAVMLVLDCSSSLGEDFATLQECAKTFIATICNDGWSNEI